MESEIEPKLPLFSASHVRMKSAERSGMITPPLQASASVPFRWEDEPGKPKPCTTTLTIFSNPNDFAQNCLELPPRMSLDAKITNLSSPTTVFQGPCMGRARFQASSFITGSECYGSFPAATGNCSPPEMVQHGTTVLNKRGFKDKGFLGSWRRILKARRQVGGNSNVFPSSGDRDSECCYREVEESSSSSVKTTRMRKVGSFLCPSHSKSHFWASIYGNLKQVVPWSKTKKKDGLMC